MGKDNFDIEMSEDITLESILAEYKGNSFIDGDKRTPKDVLDEKARRIVREESGLPEEPSYASVDAESSDSDDEFAIDPVYFVVEKTGSGERDKASRAADISEKAVADEKVDTAPDDAPIDTVSGEDRDLDYSNSYDYSSESPEDEIIQSVAAAIESEEEAERESSKRSFFRFREDKPLARRRGASSENEWTAETGPEPDYRQAARSYIVRCNSLAGRAILALVLSLLVVLLTLLFEGGKSLPFGIGRSVVSASGTLLILQLLIMMVGIDILVRGAMDAFHGAAGVETLVLVSCLATVFAGIYGMRSGTNLLPYSAIAALSLTFTIWGERMRMEAIASTLRAAAAITEPFSVVSEHRSDLDRTVLKKTSGRYKGFYSNLMQENVSETAYKLAVPLLLLFMVLITLYSAIAQRSMASIPRMLAALAAAAATFTASLSFAAPFRAAANRARRANSAIAGAGGADDIFYTDGCCITDEDLYPPDSLSVSNVRILDQVSPEKAIRYTASLIAASESCLARVFSGILSSEGMSIISVQDFAASEGGISGLIRGERVLTGSFAFMNLYGIRVPDELKLGNSVYTAVNGKLIAMFSVEYRPSVMVRNAIVNILRRGVRLFLTVRDFNITPMTIEQKFKVPMDDFEMLPISSTYKLADNEDAGRGRAAALCARGALPEMSELIEAGRQLKVVSLISTIVSVASAIAGVLMMSVLCWAGASTSAQCGSLLLFMTAPLVIMILTQSVMGIRKK